MSVAKRPKLRDVNKQDVFLFIDNIFCLVQAPSLGSMDDDALLEEQRGMASCCFDVWSLCCALSTIRCTQVC